MVLLRDFGFGTFFSLWEELHVLLHLLLQDDDILVAADLFVFLFHVERNIGATVCRVRAEHTLEGLEIGVFDHMPFETRFHCKLPSAVFAGKSLLVAMLGGLVTDQGLVVGEAFAAGVADGQLLSLLTLVLVHMTDVGVFERELLSTVGAEEFLAPVGAFPVVGELVGREDLLALEADQTVGVVDIEVVLVQLGEAGQLQGAARAGHRVRKFERVLV